jgi:signal transduction histidine kinase
MVDGDPHLLTRAIENLLDNALRHTPGGGVIRITCHDGDTTITFSVADTGPGIPPDDLPRIFSPLFRADTSRSRSTGGAGLGLVITQRILRAHGGVISASNRLTGGAIFSVHLPAALAVETSARPTER